MSADNEEPTLPFPSLIVWVLGLLTWAVVIGVVEFVQWVVDLL